MSTATATWTSSSVRRWSSGRHFGRVTGVLFNLSRQLTALRLARVGLSWPLAVQAVAPGSLALLMLAASELSPRLSLGPLGQLGIDPSTTVTLPVVLAGVAPNPQEIPLLVPANSALVDVTIFAQALVVPPGGTLLVAHLSGVVRENITW